MTGFAIIIIICVSIMKIQGSVFITDPIISFVIEFCRREPYCQVHRDRENITSLLQTYPKRFSVINTEALYKMEHPCESRQSYGFIYPGTLWCGEGTKAFDYSDLGIHTEEDKCCREHDNCPNSLASGECRAEACNTSRFTRSHCDCDKKFQQCLQKTGTETGNTIGAIFFNVAQIVCFRERNCTNAERISAKEDPSNIGNNGGTMCPLQFAETDRYIASEPRLTLKHKKAFVLNFLLRKFGVLKR